MVDADSLEFVLFLTSIPFYVIGFIGNALVIRIVHKTREMNTTTSYLLVNLAFSDAITISTSPLYFFSYLSGHLSNGHLGHMLENCKRLICSPSLNKVYCIVLYCIVLYCIVLYCIGFGKFACKFLALSEIAIVVSAYTLTVLAIERYHALLKPFNTGLRLNEDNIKKAIALIWVSSVLGNFPLFFFQEWSGSHSRCTGPWSLHMTHATEVYVIINAVVCTYTPLAVMLYCYGSLINGLYFTKTVCPETDGQRISEKKKLVITLILATIGFSLGYGPITVFYTVIASGGGERMGSKVHSVKLSVTAFLFICSLCLNPILYAFRSTSFKEGFKRIILCRKGTPPNEIQL